MSIKPADLPQWFYVYGAVWTTPDDTGECVATRSSKAEIEPTEKDRAMRLCAAAPELLHALQRLTHPMADDTDVDYALAVIAKATGGQS